MRLYVGRNHDPCGDGWLITLIGSLKPRFLSGSCESLGMIREGGSGACVNNLGCSSMSSVAVATQR